MGLVLMHRAMLNKSLVQFSVDGWGCVPSLLFGLGPNYGGGNEDSGDLLQKVPCTHCYTQCPQPCSRPPPTHASARHSWTLTGKSPVGSLLLGPGVHKDLFVPSKSLFPQSCVSSGVSLVGLMVTSSKLEAQKSASRFYIQESPRVVGNQDSPLVCVCAHTHLLCVPAQRESKKIH